MLASSPSRIELNSRRAADHGHGQPSLVAALVGPRHLHSLDGHCAGRQVVRLDALVAHGGRRVAGQRDTVLQDDVAVLG